MENISSSTNLNIRVDSKLKKEADELFKRLGLNMSSAINVFLSQSVREQAIPFEIREHTPSKELLESLKEAKSMAKKPQNYKWYDNTKKLFEDLDK